MPIHIVPLIVGGTIAVVGTGYAFKKFVYDPHMAPAIEAFFATRSTETRRLNEPVSVRTTARERFAEVKGLIRRRGRGENVDTEEREGLLCENQGRRMSAPQNPRGNGLVSDMPEYEMTQHVRSNVRTPISNVRSPSVRSSSDRPRPQDDEIRSIIFNTPLPASDRPAASAETSGIVLTGAGSTMLIPNISLPTAESPGGRSPSHPIDPSTTFSFLSLSQVSSPEAPTANLETMSFSLFDQDSTRREYEQRGRSVRDGGLSSPEAMSGYDSGDMISAMSSPRYRDQPLHYTTSTAGEAWVGSGAGAGAGAGGLGLNTVGEVGMNYISPPRTSRSVISLSESEGEGGSDWDILSEARAGSS